jgi:uncharacterized protein (TIGR00251 family)
VREDGAQDALEGIVEPSGDGVMVQVHVQPRAGRAGLVGRHGDALRIRVKAPPVGGRANEETAAVLAAALGVPARAVVLVAGATSRVKRFRVTGVDAPSARRRLRTAFGPPPG